MIHIKSGITVNFDVSAKLKENIKHRKNIYIYIWNPSACTCKNGEYAENIIDDSVITCDKIIEATKSVLTNFCISIFFPYFYLFINYNSIIDNC